jgi:hypothetical protein
MKSSGFGWEASFAVEILATSSFLTDDEFCANAELVAANATNIRVITRKFFWFTGSFLTTKLEFGANTARIVNNVNSPACTIPIERHCVSLKGSRSRIVAARIESLLSRNSGKTDLQQVLWHEVSTATCQVTWRVMEMQWPVGFFNEKKPFCSDCGQKPAIRAD